MINESLLQPDTPSALDICNAALSKIGEWFQSTHSLRSATWN